MFRYYFRSPRLPLQKIATPESTTPSIQAFQYATRPSWSEEEINDLLDTYQEYLKRSGVNYSENHIWREVTALLEEKGVHRLASQCKSKWRRMRMAYESAEALGNESLIPHHEKIGQILKARNASQRDSFRSKDVTEDMQVASPSERSNSSPEIVSKQLIPDKPIQIESSKPQSASVRDITSAFNGFSTSYVKHNDGTFEGHGLSHKLVELLRNQLEFQNHFYRNIIEEFQTSRREEHQLRSEILATLKEIKLAKTQNPQRVSPDNYNNFEKHQPIEQVFAPQSSPFQSHQQLDDGIDIFEADENMRALKENLSHTDFQHRES
ncbi:hypothetical protein K493DRAFT_74787 [Basidiobolus meristosporus CBS 931.73]|uniref:Myb-like domain-containing protein n=1 Tax=Basidiobolus meristosporus CBS 931.73 TaxID=1314790 RepID=A0A1Y1ZC67_9FUNG|nr:hypothetical protein K493DRAFT_74787 [Basidiobolus meristosporus CBS 931.73]|eukprot:ORY07838.1 hypothetical protein K493DRAFT_74787 [Basidiobolus meristosporus CBS 931.73]